MKSSPICLLLAAGLSWIPSLPASATTAGLGTSVPAVMDGVQNLNFSTGNATNTTIPGAPSDYVAGDNVAVGQTFTTGSNENGYSLSAISVRQISWGNTFWDYTGGTVTLQIFRWEAVDPSIPGANIISQFAVETADIGGEPDGVTFTSGTPGANARWLTVTLDNPVVLLPDTMYGFQIVSSGTGGNDGFFMQIDGTNTDSYPDGFATGTGFVEGAPNPSSVWDGNSGRPSDRAFVATMTALASPTPPVFVVQPQNTSALVGNALIIRAAVMAAPAPTFQWEHSPDGIAPYTPVADGFAIYGANTETLTIDPAQYSNRGFYRLVAENAGTATSDPAEATLIYPDPEILFQPESVIGNAGSEVQLQVAATGLGDLSYQWHKVDGAGSMVLIDDAVFSGTTTDILVISGLSSGHEGEYFVVVTDDAAEADGLTATQTTSGSASVLLAEMQATSSDTPPAVDAADQYYFPGVVSDANNVSGGGDQFTYLAFDRGSRGMSFTTGTDPLGYTLSSISVQHVAHDLTSFDLRDGDGLKLAVGTLSGTTKTVIYQSDKVRYSGEDMAGMSTTGTGRFITFDLSGAGIGTLSPNTTYYLELATGIGSPFIDLNGTSADGYPGGGAFRGTTVATIDGTYSANTGDRAFHADLTGLTAVADDFATWIRNYPEVGAATGFDEDADADGIPNGVENVFATDPSQTTNGIVELQVSGDTITFQHPNSDPASDVTAGYVWSSDLVTFHNDATESGGTTVSFNPVTDTPVAGTTTVTATITGTLPARVFVAMKAVKAAP
jgi:hypothetical protein